VDISAKIACPLIATLAGLVDQKAVAYHEEHEVEQHEKFVTV
jgi:hypothetical protein